MSPSPKPSPAPRLLCFGFGYTARALAGECLDRGWHITATWRGGDEPPPPADEPPPPVGENTDLHVFTRHHPLDGDVFAGVTHVLNSVPPDAADAAGDPVADVHGGDLAALKGLQWVGYLSTTGVYGDRDGGWVDETSPLAPTSDRARRRQAAEESWLKLFRQHAVPVHIFRLAGIYGPGRSVLDTIRAGAAKRVVKPGQVFSRIHVADIARVLAASMARPNPGAVYNVCDDIPAPPQDVVAYGCQLLGVAPPPEVAFAAAELSAMAREFYADNKRVRNDRIKDELGVKLEFPDYRAGLDALARGQ